MLAAVAHQQHAHVSQLGAALSALVDRARDAPRLHDLPRIPMGALDRPRHHVLEPAEGRFARAGDLLHAPAVLALDLAATPVTLLAHGWK